MQARDNPLDFDSGNKISTLGLNFSCAVCSSCEAVEKNALNESTTR